MRRHERSPREGLGFGLLLMALGVVLLLDRLHYLDYDLSLARLWPWFVIGWGVVRIVGWQSPRRVGGGVTTLLMGTWFLIAVNEWQGLGWTESWPLALVAVGTGIIVRAGLQKAWPAGADPGDWNHAGRGDDASGSVGGGQ